MQKARQVERACARSGAERLFPQQQWGIGPSAEEEIAVRVLRLSGFWSGKNRVREEMPLVELSRNKEGGRTAVVKARAAAAGVVVLR